MKNDGQTDSIRKGPSDDFEQKNFNQNFNNNYNNPYENNMIEMPVEPLN